MMLTSVASRCRQSSKICGQCSTPLTHRGRSTGQSNENVWLHRWQSRSWSRLVCDLTCDAWVLIATGIFCSRLLVDVCQGRAKMTSNSHKREARAHDRQGRNKVRESHGEAASYPYPRDINPSCLAPHDTRPQYQVHHDNPTPVPSLYLGNPFSFLLTYSPWPSAALR